MAVDLARLRSIARGEIAPKNGVTGVADVARYASKSPELRQLRPLRVKNTELEKDAFEGVAQGVASPRGAVERACANAGNNGLCACGSEAVLTVYDSANPSEPTRMCRACCDALYREVQQERTRQAP
jgi:hypothetical protein